MITNNKFNKNIVLIGFMGCGKSTVGLRLAKILNTQCIDTDKQIESELKINITQIFKDYGEQYFRCLESEKIKQLSNFNNIVIASGGGAVLNRQNVVEFKKNAIIVYLRATPEHIYNNLKNDMSRPLLNSEEKEDTIKRLLIKRDPIYQAACDFIVDVTNKNMDSTITEILNLIELYNIE